MRKYEKWAEDIIAEAFKQEGLTPPQFNRTRKNAMGVDLDDLQDVMNECLRIFKQAIQIAVYDYYEPTWYADGTGVRTEQLIDNATVEFTGSKIILGFNYENMHYRSKFPDEPADPELVTLWVDQGHYNKKGYIQDQFHQYEARNFLRTAERMLEQHFHLSDGVVNINPMK